MTIQEWREEKSGEHHIPLWKFLLVTHYYTERVGVYVVSGNNWQRGAMISGCRRTCSKASDPGSIWKNLNGC